MSGAISLVRSTVGQGTDFLVFWKAGRAILEGGLIYDRSQGGMVFKYPPWIAPVFVPVSLFSFEQAKWIWGAICVASLVWVVRILQARFGISRGAWFPVILLYWGLWAVHALDGQIILPLLALGLGGLDSGPLPSAATALGYTAKIFTLFPFGLMAAKTPSRYFNPRFVFWVLTGMVGLSWVSCRYGFHGDWRGMWIAWKQSAVSGATALDAGLTRGPKNQSLTSFICRHLDVSATDSLTEALISCVFYLGAYLSLSGMIKKWGGAECWLVGLALTPVFHPLPWHHLYVLTFPLSVYGLELWLRNKGRISGAVFFSALFLITLSHGRALGGIGDFLEYNVGRAWGALLMVAWFAAQKPIPALSPKVLRL